MDRAFKSALLVLGLVAQALFSGSYANAGSSLSPPAGPAPIPSAPPFSQHRPTPPGALACTPPLMDNESFTLPSTQHWFIKAGGSRLDISVSAVAVNVAEESGSIIATLFDGANVLGSVTVAHPTGAGASNGDANTALLTAGSDSGLVYRLQIDAGAASPGQREARHYRLRLAAADEAGVQSPGLFNYEGGVARWGLSVNAGEDLSVTVLPGNVGDPLSGSATLIDPSGAVHSTTAIAGTTTLSVASAAAGQWQVAVASDHHYSMDKTSGSDRGLYLNWLTNGSGRVRATVTRAGGTTFLRPVDLTLRSLLTGETRTYPNSFGIDEGNLFVGPYMLSAAAPAGETYTVTPSSVRLDITCDGKAFAAFDVPNLAPTASIDGPGTMSEGTQAVFPFKADDPDRDPFATNVTVTGGTLVSQTPGSVTVRADDGPATITISATATDALGASGTATKTVSVTNVAPAVTISAPASGAVIAVNTPLGLAGSFADPGADTWTASWTVGSTQLSGVVSGHDVSGTTTLTAAGIYPISLTVTDDDGGSGTATTVAGDLPAYVVVYDPSGGFVTGGGWITSPAGAYRADTSMSGRATFGLVSKYLPGRTTPSGETEFQFRTARFNFHSTDYEWLVVSGPRARYTGTGTINGSGSYRFTVTVIDGQISGGGGTDKFRIRIWGDSGLVYDNEWSDDPNADPTTLLGGGSIVIHRES